MTAGSTTTGTTGAPAIPLTTSASVAPPATPAFETSLRARVVSAAAATAVITPLVGTDRDDRLYGTTAADRIYGGHGGDHVEGGAGNDTIWGGPGDDVYLRGNAGNDRIYGEAGNDQINGGAGDDQLVGGAGDDVYWYDRGDGGSDVHEEGGTDALRFYNLSAADVTKIARSGDDMVVSVAGGRVTVHDHFKGGRHAVERFEFTDGAARVVTTWGRSVFEAKASGAGAPAPVPAPAPTPPPTRDWRTSPFSPLSPWNHPMGDGAVFAAVPGLSSLASSINYDDKWTVSVAVAKATDPEVNLLVNASWPTTNWSFLNGGGRTHGNSAADEARLRSWSRHYGAGELPMSGNAWSTTSTPDDAKWVLPTGYHRAGQDYRNRIRMPPGVYPSPDSDGLLTVVQPDGWAVDIYAGVVLSNGDVVAGDVASFVDLRGDGTGWWNGRRASMLPSIGGLIREGEIASGRIPHALVATLPASFLTERATWPAVAFDRNSGYSGDLPMGSLLALPPDVDLNSLGLTPSGLAVARAAQDYGIYVADRGGGGMTFQAELGNDEIRWSGWQKDLDIILDRLKRVANNGPTSRGGGGTPRAPLAPPLAN